MTFSEKVLRHRDPYIYINPQGENGSHTHFSQLKDHYPRYTYNPSNVDHQQGFSPHVICTFK